MRGAISVALSVFWLVGLSGSAVGKDSTGPPENAAAVYREALDAMDIPALTEEEKYFLVGGSVSGVDETARADKVRAELVRRFQPSIELLRQAAKVHDCQWGLSYEETGLLTDTPCQGMIYLMRAAGWDAQARLAHDTRAFVEGEMAVVAAGRHVGGAGPVFPLLAGYGMEQRSIEALAAQLPRLPMIALADLESRWISAPPGNDMGKAVVMSKISSTDWLIRRIRRAMAADAEDLAAAGTESGPPYAMQDSSLAGLRVSALVLIDGLPPRVGFEREGGESFFLRLGEKKRGIQLLSVDYACEEAVILVDGRTALLCLRSRRIVPFELQITRQVLVDILGEDSASELLEVAGNDASAFLDLLRRADADLERLSAAMELPPAEFEPWCLRFEGEMEKTSPLSKWFFSGMGMVRMKEAEIQTQRAMLAAGIRILHEGPDAATTTTDPYGKGPFRHEPTENGFRLVSDLTWKGQPVVLEFGNGPS